MWFLDPFKFIYTKNNATISGIVMIDNSVVINTALAANETSPSYSVANNTAVFATGIEIIINVTPKINGSLINKCNIG